RAGEVVVEVERRQLVTDFRRPPEIRHLPPGQRWLLILCATRRDERHDDRGDDGRPLQLHGAHSSAAAIYSRPWRKSMRPARHRGTKTQSKSATESQRNRGTSTTLSDRSIVERSRK